MFADEPIPNERLFRWSGSLAPVPWQIRRRYGLPRYAPRDFGRRDDQIIRRIVWVQVNEVFHDGERKAFRGVGKTRANA